MATIPSQETKAVNDKVTAAWANSDVRDSVDFILSNKPLGFFVQQAAQTGWTTATFTAVTFGASSEVIDRDTQHSTASNTSRVVIGDTLGWYRVNGVYVAAANSACTLVRACIAYSSAGGAATEVNGSATSMSPASTGSTLALPTGSVLIEATNALDYIQLDGWMTAGSGTLGTAVGSIISSSLTVEYVGKS
jgi:hypothetical protein